MNVKKKYLFAEIIIGKILELKEDETGLFIEARISDSEIELKTKVREEIFKDMSIGYIVTKAKMEQKNDGTWIRHIYEVKLYECSIVTESRHPDTHITEKKQIENALGIIDTIYKEEKNEEKRYKLLQLKSLIEGEPDEEPLIAEEPIKKEIKSIFDKIEFE